MLVLIVQGALYGRARVQLMAVDPLAAVRAALIDLDAAHDRAVAAIQAAADLDAAFTAATELEAHMRRLDASDAELRTNVVGRMWDADRLSLAALASRIGVSKTRADQLVRSVKQQRQQEES